MRVIRISFISFLLMNFCFLTLLFPASFASASDGAYISSNGDVVAYTPDQVDQKTGTLAAPKALTNSSSLNLSGKAFTGFLSGGLGSILGKFFQALVAILKPLFAEAFASKNTDRSNTNGFLKNFKVVQNMFGQVGTMSCSGGGNPFSQNEQRAYARNFFAASFDPGNLQGISSNSNRYLGSVASGVCGTSGGGSPVFNQGSGVSSIKPFTPTNPSTSNQTFKDSPFTQPVISSAPIVRVGPAVIDFDGSPTAYGPNGRGDDYLANAGRPGNWWGVATDRNGNPIINPKNGYYVSTTAWSNGPSHLQSSYVDASSVPYVAITKELRSLGIKYGDFVKVTSNNGQQVWAVVADYAGSRPKNHAEVSPAVLDNLRIPYSKKGVSATLKLEFYPGSKIPGFFPRTPQDINKILQGPRIV